jgi:hypothetical protein
MAVILAVDSIPFSGGLDRRIADARHQSLMREIR